MSARGPCNSWYCKGCPTRIGTPAADHPDHASRSQRIQSSLALSYHRCTVRRYSRPCMGVPSKPSLVVPRPQPFEHHHSRITMRASPSSPHGRVKRHLTNMAATLVCLHGAVLTICGYATIRGQRLSPRRGFRRAAVFLQKSMLVSDAARLPSAWLRA